MDGLGALLLVAAVFVANFPAVITQWRTDRPGAIKTVWMSGLYLLYVGLGIALLLLLVPGEGGSEKIKSSMRSTHIARLALLYRT